MSALTANRQVTGPMNVQTAHDAEVVTTVEASEEEEIATAVDARTQAPAEVEVATEEDTEAEIETDTGEEEKDLHRPTPDPDQTSHFRYIVLNYYIQVTKQKKGEGRLQSEV